MLKHAKSLRTFDTLPALDASKLKPIDMYRNQLDLIWFTPRGLRDSF